jgi:hypothetical protein
MAAIGTPRNDAAFQAHGIEHTTSGEGVMHFLEGDGVYHGRFPPFSLSFRLNLAGRKSGQVAASPIKL